ncbi:HpcH/HpaI aldolase/citrate lyase family protein [Rhodococcus sp. IEGM1428]|uniref:HpcH/HpaI aldolase/citrate lyase family protein n=1 Tax=Rhodococcus sp. IEGM1428 TaxID=3392191 RepID=UPI003D09AB8A
MTNNREPWISGAKSLLFAPASRPERFDRADSSGADGIVLDLEDGVAEADKADALGNAITWLRNGSRAIVRINGSGTDWQLHELKRLGDLADVTVMVPKVETIGDINVVAAALRPGRHAIVATVETAWGLLNLPEICSAPSVVRIGFGNVDLATDLGVRATDRAALQYSRSAVVAHSRAFGLAAPLDGVTLDTKNETVVADDAAYAASLGFGGRICIHPAQVARTNEAFAPSASELEWAARVVAGSEHSAVGVIDGEMVDKPVVERARRILARRGTN